MQKSGLMPALIIFLFFITACCTGNVRDYYDHIPGKAKITSIEVSVYSPDGKSSFREVFFEFIPDDPSAPARYRFKNFKDEKQRLFIEYRGILPAEWVRKSDIKVGSVYPAVRMEKKGSCGGAPVVFEVRVE